MPPTRRWISIAALGVAAVLSSPAVAQETSGRQFSGFLGDYSQLKEEKDSNGDTVLRYVSPKLTPAAYSKLLIDPVQFYPSPRPSEFVDAQALNDIRNYVDKALRDKIGSKVALATAPGPGVVRVRPAITAVAAQSPGLKPYELLPIGFLYSSAKGRGKEAALTIEIEMLDSTSGERLGAAVRRGTGQKLPGDEKKLRLEHVRPLLDQWTDAGMRFAAERLAK